MSPENRAALILSLALAATSASAFGGDSIYTWNPNPTGPYGLNFFDLSTQGGSFSKTSGTDYNATLDFGDGVNAALHPGLLTDLSDPAGLVVDVTYQIIFTANGYTIRSNTEAINFSQNITFSVSDSVTATFSVNAQGTFTKIGRGTLNLDQPYTNSVMNVSNGTLALLNPNLLSNSSIYTSPTTTLSLGASNQTADTIGNQGSLFAAGAYITLSNLANSGYLSLTGGGLSVATLVNDGTIIADQNSPGTADGDLNIGALSGAGNIFLGNTSLTAGSNAPEIDVYSGNISGSGTLIKTGASELILQGITSITNGLGAPNISVIGGTLAGNTNNLRGTITSLANTTLIFAQTASGTFAGNITGNGTVDLGGLLPGVVLTFPNSNLFTGNLNLNTDIILAVSADGPLGLTGTRSPTFSNVSFLGGTLRTTASFSSPRPFSVGQFGGTIDTFGNSPTFSGPFTSTGNGTFSFIGGGTATLSAANSSLNALSVNSTSLALSSANLSLASSFSLLGNSNLTISSSTLTSGPATLATAPNASANVSLSGLGTFWKLLGNLSAGLDLASNGIFASPPGNAAIVINSSTSLSVSGATTLSGASSITVNSGVFSTGSLSSTPNAAATITLSDFSLISPSTPSLVIGSDTAPNGFFGGSIIDGSHGSGTLHKVGSNSQTLSGNDSYSGPTLIDAGNLIIASNSALPANSPIYNNATFTISAPAVTANTISGNGTLSLGASDRLTLAGAAASKQSALSLASLALLDIASSPFILETNLKAKSFVLTQIRADIASAKASNGGITSSAVNANPTHLGLAVIDNSVTQFTTFGGQPVDSTSILIAPELLGDANADGKIDLTDLSTILNNFGQSTPNWTSGNFDNAPTIDLTDLSDVLNNFGQTNPSAFTLQPSAFSNAPEPASLTILALASLLMAHRRRRRSQN